MINMAYLSSLAIFVQIGVVGDQVLEQIMNGTDK